MAQLKLVNSKMKTPLNFLYVLKRDILENRYIYILAIPVLFYYAIFHYGPMYGLVIAFKDFNPALGIWKSPWVGFENFLNFFSDYAFVRLLRNTLLINVYDLLFGFPIPIIFALLLNEIKHNAFKRIVQTVSYLPYFISVVVICGIIRTFVASDGVITQLLSVFGVEQADLLAKSELFRTIFVSSEIWQHFGWSSIIYIAALTNIDPTYYEAAIIDGAGRFKQILHITIPCLAPTIIILLILRIGRLMSIGWEKVILLYNPLNYETADVIQSYVYRRGLQEYAYSFSSAVGLFNSMISFVLVITANKISKTFSKTSLW